jgi:predicted ABC-type ATPase
MKQPKVVVFGGVNGAGKTTVANEILRVVLNVPVFTNSDAIARGLNALDVEKVAFKASRVMLEWMNELVEERQDFAFETTLAARSYANWLRRLKSVGYRVYLYYYWLPSADVAVERVKLRVERGGHHIPETDIRRRYGRSVWNFVNLYQNLADYWEVWDNTHSPRRLIGVSDGTDVAYDSEQAWNTFLRTAHDGSTTNDA